MYFLHFNYQPVNSVFILIIPLLENHKKKFKKIAIFYNLIKIVYSDTYKYIYIYIISFKPDVAINRTLLNTVNTYLSPL